MQCVHFEVGVGIFNCAQMLTKISFIVYLWYCGKKQIECGLAWSALFSDNDTGHHSGKNLLWNHFLFRHIDKARDGHFWNLSSRFRTSPEVIIAEYDAILGQWEHEDFYKHLSNYTNVLYKHSPLLY